MTGDGKSDTEMTGGGARLDIARNRAALKYAHGEVLRRLLWALVRLLFRFSPRPWFGWRRFLLRLFGADIGREVHVYATAFVYMPWNLNVGDWSSIGEHAFVYNLGPVTIGNRVTVSYRAHICAGTHDYRDPAMTLLKPPVNIGSDAWICTDAFVGPGVTVGEGAVVGARAVVVRNVTPWSVVAGNPAREVNRRRIHTTPQSSGTPGES